MRADDVACYYSEKTDSQSTTSTSYIDVTILDPVANGASGETWVFVCSALVTHPGSLFNINTRLNWQIQTGASTYVDLETHINHCAPMSLGTASDRGMPSTRTYKATLAMSAPKIRLRMSMSSAGCSTGGQVSDAHCFGFKKV